MAPLRRNRTSYDIGKDEACNEGRDEGREMGRDEGRRLGHLELLEAQLESRFGPLPEESLAKLRALPDDRLRPLAIALTAAGMLGELGL